MRVLVKALLPPPPPPHEASVSAVKLANSKEEFPFNLMICFLFGLFLRLSKRDILSFAESVNSKFLFDISPIFYLF